MSLLAILEEFDQPYTIQVSVNTVNTMKHFRSNFPTYIEQLYTHVFLNFKKPFTIFKFCVKDCESCEEWRTIDCESLQSKINRWNFTKIKSNSQKTIKFKNKVFSHSTSFVIYIDATRETIIFFNLLLSGFLVPYRSFLFCSSFGVLCIKSEDTEFGHFRAAFTRRSWSFARIYQW